MRGARSATNAEPVLTRRFPQSYTRSLQSPASYGYRPLTALLRAQVERAGKTQGARLMREEALADRQRSRFRPRPTDSNHGRPIAPTGSLSPHREPAANPRTETTGGADSSEQTR